MTQAHLFDINTIAWADHPTLPGLQVKGLEGRATHPHLSVMLVRVEAGGVIPRHAHDVATETALVVAGRGELYLDAQVSEMSDTSKVSDISRVVAFVPGVGVSIPPGLYHSVRNTGDAPLEILAIHTPPTR